MNTGEQRNRLELLKTVVRKFDLYGEFIDAKPFGSGHINGTFVSLWNQAGTPVRYLHQRINEKVFLHPDEVMDNIQRVTSHIMKKLELSGVPDRSRRTSQVVPAKNGELWVRDETGGWWRTYLFIEGVKTCELAGSPGQARILGSAVGKFQKLLADLPGPRLHESIPHFHDMVFRYLHFDETRKRDVCKRAAGSDAEIAFMNENRTRGEMLIRNLMDGGLPERICHNDTKMNNILFNEELTEGICVTDLDTVMPGTVLYDVGDLIRTVATRAAEDETDLSVVRFDTEYFEALVDGYLSEAACFLTDAESALIAEAGRYITHIMALRFLTDYLEGDIYYKTGRAEHNLDRCRNQIALIRDMDNQWDSIMEILRNLRLRYAQI
ncbi:MAG: phosphotransferase [Spirochaetaceae bacterium]|jgi:Ser/Thr protein kinase RdoA (MazF antagonist)|nr:phosphotransferase [Spirochaetaceae bacterium]